MFDFFKDAPCIKAFAKNGVLSKDVVCMFVPKLPEYDVPILYMVSVEYKFLFVLFK